jgi:SAM-dependent methyltransferase
MRVFQFSRVRLSLGMGMKLRLSTTRTPSNEHIQRGSTAAGDVYTDADSVTAVVKEYYGKILSNTKDLKTSACTACGKPPAAVRGALKNVPKEVLDRFYGCGNPVPSAGIEGLHVLDLGCGSGRDCYVAAHFVGPTGKVTGVDMTDEQLSIARRSMDEFAAKTKGKASTDRSQVLLHHLSAVQAPVGAAGAPVRGLRPGSLLQGLPRQRGKPDREPGWLPAR